MIRPHAMYTWVLLLHIVAGSVWTGGHIYLATRVLPRVLRERSAALLLEVERSYEPLGMSALVIQIVTGGWMAYRILSPSFWTAFEYPAVQWIYVKFGLLALTVAFAIDARFRVLPRLRDENVAMMAPHIIGVTVLGVLFIAAGVAIRTGGF
jgi:putative copper export protein